MAVTTAVDLGSTASILPHPGCYRSEQNMFQMTRVQIPFLGRVRHCRSTLYLLWVWHGFLREGSGLSWRRKWRTWSRWPGHCFLIVVNSIEKSQDICDLIEESSWWPGYCMLHSVYNLKKTRVLVSQSGRAHEDQGTLFYSLYFTMQNWPGYCYLNRGHLMLTRVLLSTCSLQYEQDKGMCVRFEVIGGLHRPLNSGVSIWHELSPKDGQQSSDLLGLLTCP